MQITFLTIFKCLLLQITLLLLKILLFYLFALHKSGVDSTLSRGYYDTSSSSTRKTLTASGMRRIQRWGTKFRISHDRFRGPEPQWKNQMRNKECVKEGCCSGVIEADSHVRGLGLVAIKNMRRHFFHSQAYLDCKLNIYISSSKHKIVIKCTLCEV